MDGYSLSVLYNLHSGCTFLREAGSLTAAGQQACFACGSAAFLLPGAESAFFLPRNRTNPTFPPPEGERTAAHVNRAQPHPYSFIHRSRMWLHTAKNPSILRDPKGLFFDLLPNILLKFRISPLNIFPLIPMAGQNIVDNRLSLPHLQMVFIPAQLHLGKMAAQDLFPIL